MADGQFGDRAVRPSKAGGERLDRRRPGLTRLAAGAAALLLIVAACGGAAGSPAATSTAVSTPESTPTADVTASPEATASPLVTPVPTPVAVAECTPGTPTALSVDWVEQVSLSGYYRFARPADYADLSAQVTLPTNLSVSPGTFAETGLTTDAKHQVDAVRVFDGSVIVSAWVIDGVTTKTDDLFERELAWLKTQPQLQTVLDEELEACIGGSRARGFSSTWDGPVHIVPFIVQRSGKMYEIQLTAKDPADVDILYEVLNSWEFTEPLGPSTDLEDDFAATDFKVVGMAAAIDDSGDHPNEADFRSVFPADLQRIYVIYELDDDVADTVNFSWQRDGREFFTSSFPYTATIGFAYGGIIPGSSGRFATGSYTVTLSLEESGDTITVPFTVE